MVNGLMRALARLPRNRGRGLSLLLLVGALVAHALPSAAQSQATTAEINGRVIDAQGGVLPGVTVTATAEATGYVRSTVTNGEGYFGLPLLPPGQYDLTME